MTDEDRTVGRLKGHNILIKFKDGEELTLHVDDIDDEGLNSEWFQDVEQYLNRKIEYFPTAGFSVAPDVIKYVRRI